MRSRLASRATALGVAAAIAAGCPLELSAQVLFQMEGGTLNKTDTYVDPVWDTVNLQHTYTNPAVFIIPRNDGNNSADFRMRNITPASFETTTVEPPGWDGPHVAMTVSYIVAEAGGWFLTPDRFIYIGFVYLKNIVNSEEEDWETVILPQGFTNPIVLAQLQEMPNEQNNLPTETSQPWFTAAVRNVTSSSFEVALDGGRCTHVSTSPNPDCVGPYTLAFDETLAYLVIEGNVEDEFVDANSNAILLKTILTGPTILGWSDGGTSVSFPTSPPFSATPLFVAKPQTRLEADGGWFRFRNLTTTSVTLLIDEAIGDSSTPRSQQGGVGERAGALLFSQNFAVQDLDPDKDMVPVPYDNCPFIHNPLQEDVDLDGEGDACDCGDGLVVASEHCDDGNLVNGDGCSDQCLHEPGWWCTGEPSVCDGICGDGILRGTEVCDDGNTTDDATCASDCQSYCGDEQLDLDHGEICDGSELGGATCTSIGLGFTGGVLACDDWCVYDVSGCTLCGNGALEQDEVCDDGNNVGGDGCSSTCQPESGWICNGDPTVCEPICGDGLFLGFETCDDGNTTGGDGCSSSCQVEPGWECQHEPSDCDTLCGDGLKLGDEECDDGNTADGDGCSSSCLVEPGWICPGGIEMCTGICGNGTIEGDEPCDDGNDETGDGCTPDCKVEPGWECAGEPSYCVAVCGDGVILGLEACDDGNALGGDGCSGTCQLENGWSCAGEPTVCTATCGDGFVVGEEACDDFNNEAGDGCDPNCQVEPGYVCAGSPSVCALACGNGTVEDREECDDRNHSDGDGCSSACEIEPGFICQNSPSVCCRDEDQDGECDSRVLLGGSGGGGCYCQGGPGAAPDGGLPLVLLLFVVPLLWRRVTSRPGGGGSSPPRGAA